jgi:hypothetical protein
VSKTEAVAAAEVSSIDDVEKERHRTAILSQLHQKYPQRIIVDVTPNYLMDLYNNQMSIDGDRAISPFLRNWVLLSGPIWDVSKISTSLIHIVLEPQGIRLIYMLFDAQIDRLSVLRPKQNIWAFCQLKKATTHDIHFENCELIDQD